MSNARLLFWVRTRQTNLTVKRAATSPRLGRGEDFFFLFFFFGREEVQSVLNGLSDRMGGLFSCNALWRAEHDGFSGTGPCLNVFMTQQEREKRKEKRFIECFLLPNVTTMQFCKTLNRLLAFLCDVLKPHPLIDFFFSIKKWISSFLIDTVCQESKRVN